MRHWGQKCRFRVLQLDLFENLRMDEFFKSVTAGEKSKSRSEPWEMPRKARERKGPTESKRPQRVWCSCEGLEWRGRSSQEPGEQTDEIASTRFGVWVKTKRPAVWWNQLTRADTRMSSQLRVVVSCWEREIGHVRVFTPPKWAAATNQSHLKKLLVVNITGMLQGSAGFQEQCFPNFLHGDSANIVYT